MNTKRLINRRSASKIIRGMLKISKKQYNQYLRTFRVFSKHISSQHFGDLLPEVRANQYIHKLTSGQAWLYTIAKQSQNEKKIYQNIGKRYPGNKYLRFFKNYRRNISNLRRVALKKTLKINKYLSTASQAFLLLFHYRTILANESAFNLYLHGVDGDLSWRFVYNVIHAGVVNYQNEVPEWADLAYNYDSTMLDPLEGIETDQEEIDLSNKTNFIPLYPDDDYPYKTYRDPETLLNRHLFILQRKSQLDYQKKDFKKI